MLSVHFKHLDIAVLEISQVAAVFSCSAMNSRISPEKVVFLDILCKQMICGTKFKSSLDGILIILVP